MIMTMVLFIFRVNLDLHVGSRAHRVQPLSLWQHNMSEQEDFKVCWLGIVCYPVKHKHNSRRARASSFVFSHTDSIKFPTTRAQWRPCSIVRSSTIVVNGVEEVVVEEEKEEEHGEEEGISGVQSQERLGGARK